MTRQGVVGLTMRKLWVDDIVPPATAASWEWAQTYAEALFVLFSGGVEVISLDYDLSDFDPKLGKEWRGEDILSWLENNAALWPREVRLHTGNPVGRKRMRGIIQATGIYSGAQFALYDNFKAHPDARPEKRQVDVFNKKV